ncbi:PERF protein, partial [Amia calva]|nr:PERF protein [Amia calva]
MDTELWPLTLSLSLSLLHFLPPQSLTALLLWAVLLLAQLESGCCQGNARLRVTVQKANELRGDHIGGTDAFVRVYYGSKNRVTPKIQGNNNPVWNIEYDFGIVPLTHVLMLDVFDKDAVYDDLLGKCFVFPKRGSFSYSCNLIRGGIFYYSYTAS